MNYHHHYPNQFNLIMSDHFADFGVQELGTVNFYKMPIYNPLDKPLQIKIYLGYDEKTIEK